MTKKASHVIQSGPWAGKTVGEKRRIKRFGTSIVEREVVGPVSVLPKAVYNAIETLPGGQIPQQRRGRNKQRGRLARLPRGMSNLSLSDSDMNYQLPRSLPVKEASAFFNSIPGLTKAGRMFLLAMTHPNNEELRSFEGIPDLMADEFNPYVSVDDSVVITWNPNLFVTPPSDQTTYGMLLIFPPILEIECVYVLFIRNSSGNAVFSMAQVVRKPGFTTATSTPVVAGTIYPTFKDIGYDAARRAGSGRTIIPICSALNNQGNIVAGQLPDIVTWTDVAGVLERKIATGDTYVTLAQITPAAGDDEVFHGACIDVPNIASLTQIDKKCMDGEFRNGAYLTMRPSEPVDVLKRKQTVFSGDAHVTAIKSTDASATSVRLACPNSFMRLRIDGQEIMFTSGSRYSTSGSTLQTPLPLTPAEYMHASISQPVDMLTGFCLIDGLSIQGAASSVSTASVKIRSTDYDELFPNSTSPSVAVYRQPHPLRDMHAMDMAASVAQVMPHALPAADNAFNGILGKIWNVIYKFGKPLAKVGKYLPIPGAATIGGLAEDALDAVNAIGDASMI